MKKYFKFTRKTLKTEDGRVLHLIKALRAFETQGHIVSKGKIGGYVESEKNLSPYSQSWATIGSVIYGDAVVSNYSYISNSKIYENAHVAKSKIINSSVSGNANVSNCEIISSSVSGNANVSESITRSSSVSGNANVGDSVIGSRISGEANVHGAVKNSRISGNANIYGTIEKNTILCK